MFLAIWGLLLAPVLTHALGSAEPAANGSQPANEEHLCTVMVPEIVTEMRSVQVCEWRNEERTGTRTVCRHIPETRSVEYEYTVPTYETHTREFVFNVYKPVYTDQQRDYTVMVPYTEKRQGTRTVCRMIPITKTRQVCEDLGSWQEVAQQAGCDCCAPKTCKVWVPKLETREVEYTVMQPRMEQVPCEYTVVLCRPEKRTETVKVCHYEKQQVSKEVPYTVCVPEKRIGTREVTTYRTVEEQQDYTYTVRVPHMVERQVPVKVCRMVAKKVPCAPASCWCGAHCW